MVKISYFAVLLLFLAGCAADIGELSDFSEANFRISVPDWETDTLHQTPGARAVLALQGDHCSLGISYADSLPTEYFNAVFSVLEATSDIKKLDRIDKQIDYVVQYQGGQMRSAVRIVACNGGSYAVNIACSSDAYNKALFRTVLDSAVCEKD